MPGKKRFRTIPFVIDTYGQTNLIYTDRRRRFNTRAKFLLLRARLLFIITSILICLASTSVGLSNPIIRPPFEFYELNTPANVETLPVPKLYDQLGATRFDKIGKLFGFRTRLVATGSTTLIPFQIYTDLNSTMNPSYGLNNTNPIYSGAIAVIPDIDEVYEVFLPKSVNGTIIRIVLGPTNGDAFHRYDMQIKVSTSGMESDSKWVPVR